MLLVIISAIILVGYGLYAMYDEQRAIASRPTPAPRPTPTEIPPTPRPTLSPERQVNRDKCVTKAGYLAAASKEDLETAYRYQQQGDWAALAQLQKDNRVFELAEGLVVFVEDRSIMANMRKIRREGSTETVWVSKDAMTCPSH